MTATQAAVTATDATKFYIDGAWVAPVAPRLIDLVNPATEAVRGKVALGAAADVDKAVAIVMGSRCGQAEASVREGLASYLGELYALCQPSVIRAC